MPPKSRTPTTLPKTVAALKPLIPAIVAPVVESVVTRLDRHEELLSSVKAALDVQFKRIAQIQAQLDALLSDIHRMNK